MKEKVILAKRLRHLYEFHASLPQVGTPDMSQQDTAVSGSKPAKRKPSIVEAARHLDSNPRKLRVKVNSSNESTFHLKAKRLLTTACRLCSPL